METKKKNQRHWGTNVRLIVIVFTLILLLLTVIISHVLCQN